jgi:hypothetical protein
LALLLVVAFGPVVATLTAQPASRLALTAAIAEHHTVDISGYPHGIDRATYNGHLRSDKAPGQPLLAVPVYLSGRALGAESEAHKRAVGNLGAWWVTLWTSFLPFVALVVLMFLVASRHTRQLPALGAALSIGVGSMMLPLAVNLYGAALAALTAYAAWAVLDAVPPTDTRLIAVGALAAASVAMEYETAIAFAVLVFVALRRVHRRIAWFGVGALGPFLVIAWYDWAAFGKPWRTAHAYYATAAIRHRIVGFEVGWRGIDATWFGPHGLLRTSPIVLAALLAAVVVARSPAPAVRRHALIGLAIAVPYLVLCMVWKGTPALEEPGPRYMIPAIPFLAVPLARLWDRIWQPAVLLAVWGAIIAVPATICFMLLGIGQSAFPELPRRVVDGEFLPTIWSMSLGRFGVVVHVASVAIVGAALVRACRVESLSTPIGSPSSSMS